MQTFYLDLTNGLVLSTDPTVRGQREPQMQSVTVQEGTPIIDLLEACNGLLRSRNGARQQGISLPDTVVKVTIGTE